MAGPGRKSLLPRFSKTKLALPTLIVLLAAGAAGYQLWSQHEARDGLDATLAGLPAGSHGHYETMSFNAFTQTMRINGLVITRDGHPSLTVQGVTLHHLSGSGTLADPFEAANVRLAGPELWRGSRSVTAALIQVDNLQVLAPDVAPPAGTPSWLVAPGSGTLLAAGTITATNIADSQGATLAAFSVADYEGGQIGQASASGFADRHGNRITMAAARAIDLDGLDAVFDTSRYGPGVPGWPAPRLLIGHAEIIGFQSKGEDGSAMIASMTLDGFAARPFRTAPTSAYVRSPAFLRDAATGVSFGAAAVTGLRYQDDKTKLSGTLSAMSASGYADGALTQASLDGLSLSGTGPSKVALGHFALTGLNATKLLHDPAGGSTASLVAAARQGAVGLASLALTNLSVTPPKGPTITLDSVDQATTGSQPRHVTVSLRGLSIPAESNPELAQGLGALGVDRLVLDLDEAGTYDTADGTAAIDPLVLTARGLGSLSLTAQFTHVPQDLPQSGPPLAAFASMGLGPFVLRFTNGSLVQRIIAMQAQQAKKTPQQITDEAKLAGSFAAAALVPDQPDAGEQVAAFIADPHVLTMTASPAAPIPLGAFLGAGRDTAKSALNLRLSAN
jgi:hypothetical protein